ncbi:hypothetical protein [Chitinimonas lacunae]|uniref:Uncharacterized protein n=1 Tax=Chitinimonas lacunae TaxID=1963018 RepID=A0ABV8MP44_9NEIS
MKRSRLLLSLAFAVLSTLVLLGVWLDRQRSAPAPAIRANCAELQRGCRIVLPDATVTLRTDRAPSALHPFRLEVTGLSSPATVRFGMAGMEMGPIAFPLSAENGRAALTATLPLCVQGRRDWLLWLDRPEGRIEVAFVAQG